MDPQYQEISERVNEEIEKKIVHLSEADFKQQYRFVKELGYGTFGWNSLYKDTATEKDVCIKTAVKSQYYKDALHEVLVSTYLDVVMPKSLRHTKYRKILVITDEHDADEKTLKIVMDFIEGDTVRNAFGSNYVEDNLPDNFPWYLMIGVLDWVIAAREQGVAHCDLHASNIMMSTPPNPEYYPDIYIIDFGRSVLSLTAVVRVKKAQETLNQLYESIDPEVYIERGSANWDNACRDDFITLSNFVDYVKISHQLITKTGHQLEDFHKGRFQYKSGADTDQLLLAARTDAVARFEPSFPSDNSRLVRISSAFKKMRESWNTEEDDPDTHVSSEDDDSVVTEEEMEAMIMRNRMRNIFMFVSKNDLQEFRALLTRMTKEEAAVILNHQSPNHNDYTILFHIIALDRGEFLKELLKHYPDTDLNERPAKMNGMTPFCLACKKNSTICAMILLGYPDLDTTLADDKGIRPITRLIRNDRGGMEILRAWIESGHDIGTKADITEGLGMGAVSLYKDPLRTLYANDVRGSFAPLLAEVAKDRERFVTTAAHVFYESLGSLIADIRESGGVDKFFGDKSKGKSDLVIKVNQMTARHHSKSELWMSFRKNTMMGLMLRLHFYKPSFIDGGIAAMAVRDLTEITLNTYSSAKPTNRRFMNISGCLATGQEAMESIFIITHLMTGNKSLRIRDFGDDANVEGLMTLAKYGVTWQERKGFHPVVDDEKWLDHLRTKFFNNDKLREAADKHFNKIKLRMREIEPLFENDDDDRRTYFDTWWTKEITHDDVSKWTSTYLQRALVDPSF